MKNILYGVLAVAIGVVFGLGLAHLSAPAASRALGGETAQVKWQAAAVSTGKLVTNSSTQILATSTSRTYATVVNDSACPVFLNLDADKGAVAHQGILVASTTSFTITTANLYSGSIRAISTCATASTTVYSN